MAEYIDRAELGVVSIDITDLPTDHGLMCYLAEDVDNMPTADVIEREKIDKAIEEIEQTLYVDSLIFGELIDFKDGKISADDVIEEFNRVTRKEVLEILDKLIESEGEP